MPGSRIPVGGEREHLGRLVLLGLVILLASACGGPPAELPAAVPTGTDVGQRAIPLQGRLASGDGFGLPARPGRPAVIVFYRGADCGLCRVQLEQMQRNLSAYERRGVRVIAATLDAPERSRRLIEDLSLGFEVVSVDLVAFAEWGTFAAERDAVMPATYIIDSDGVVRYRHIGRNAADRTLDAEVLTVIETLRAD